MLGSGQAAHQALGSQNHSSLNANLNATSAQTQRYLAGLGMGQVKLAAVFVYLWCDIFCAKKKAWPDNVVANPIFQVEIACSRLPDALTVQSLPFGLAF